MRIWPLALLLAVSCADGAAPARESPRILYLAPVGADAEGEAPTGAVSARVEIAADDLARQRGLMHRSSLPPDTGMLFVYPDEEPREFWMKNTKIPLSIAFADAAGTIVAIRRMRPGIGVPDMDLPRYPSRAPATYALEMTAGWFARKGIRVGDRLVLDPWLKWVRPR